MKTKYNVEYTVHPDKKEKHYGDVEIDSKYDNPTDDQIDLEELGVTY